MSITISIAEWTCPCCPHVNADHDDSGQCGNCVCSRRLTVKLIGGGRDKSALGVGEG